MLMVAQRDFREGMQRSFGRESLCAPGAIVRLNGALRMKQILLLLIGVLGFIGLSAQQVDRSSDIRLFLRIGDRNVGLGHSGTVTLIKKELLDASSLGVAVRTDTLVILNAASFVLTSAIGSAFYEEMAADENFTQAQKDIVRKVPPYGNVYLENITLMYGGLRRLGSVKIILK